MKKNNLLLICACFLCTIGQVSGQTYIPVTACSGSGSSTHTQTINGNTIVVSLANVTTPQAIIDCTSTSMFPCFNGSRYHIGVVKVGSSRTDAPSGLVFSFSIPVNVVKMNFAAGNNGENMRFFINGVQYLISSANIDNGACSIAGNLAPVSGDALVQFGTIVCDNSLSAYNGQINIKTQQPFDSIRVFHTTGNCAGTSLDFSFAYDTLVYIKAPFKDTVLCPGDSFTLHFGVSYRFKSSNIFKVQLSDANGSFSSPVDIGTKTTDTADSIKCVIPLNAAAGNGYRIRIISSNPIKISENNGVNIRIKPLPSPPNATNNSPLCEGATLNISSLSSTMGVTYEWNGPGSYTSNLANTSRANVTASMSGNYISTVTLNGCIAKDTTAVTIYSTPAVPTAGSNSPVCAGGDIKLTASTVPGATYEWTGPGSYFAGTQNPIRSGVAMTDGGTYSVLARVNGCPSAYGSTMVNVTAGPTVSLYPNPGDSICPGWDVTFVALPSGGGPSPTYEWFKNGVSTGGMNVTYKAGGVNDGDSFFVRMTAGTVCNTPINSKPMRITVLPTHTPPIISIAANPGAHVWPGMEVVFKATTGNAGAHPGYQWKLNGKDIPNAKDSIYKAGSLKTGDTICCIVTSNFLCAVPREVTSNCLVMSVDVGVEALGIWSKEQVYPNPNDGNFTIEAIESGAVQISNMQGQLIGEYEIVEGKNRISLPAGIAKGVYVVKVNPEVSGQNSKAESSATETAVWKVMVE